MCGATTEDFLADETFPSLNSEAEFVVWMEDGIFKAFRISDDPAESADKLFVEFSEELFGQVADDL